MEIDMDYLVNIIVTLIIVAIAGSIIWYLYRAKKRGQTCIGCPYAKQCKGKCGCGCGESKTESDNDEK